MTPNDAASEIYSAFLVAEEGTASSFRALMETFSAKGLPCSYTERGSHYFHAPKAGGKVDRTHLTQIGRARPTRRRAYRRLFAPSTRPIGANVRHLAG